MPYEQYMTQSVFIPLGMDRTTYDPTEAATWGWAQGYAKRRGVVAPAPVVLSRGMGPAGMVVTTSNDVGQYFVALLNQLHLTSGELVFDLVPHSDTAFILLGDESAFDEVPAEFRRETNGSIGFYVGGTRFGVKG